MVNGKMPSLEGKNTEELSLSIEEWFIEMRLKILPFISKHSSHKSILESNKFYIPKGRQEEIKKLLKNKA